MLAGLFDRWFIKKPRFRRAVTRAIEGDKDVAIRLAGVSLSVNSLKEHGYLRASRLARRGSFFRDETPVLISLAAVLADCDGFIDVGANIGVFSAVLARVKALKPSLYMAAFEAHPDTAQRLRRNVEPLGVEVFQMAISDSDGELEFTEGAVSHVFTGKPNAYSIAGATLKVPSRRLDGLGLPGDKLLLKVDVEGLELEVLAGAQGLFDAGRIHAVYVDCYDDAAVVEFLRTQGFTFLDAAGLTTEGELQHLLAVRP